MYIDPTSIEDGAETNFATRMEDQFLRENGIDPQMLTPLQRGQLLLALQDGQLREGENVGNLGVVILRDTAALGRAINPANSESDNPQIDSLTCTARSNIQETVAGMASAMREFISCIEETSHADLFSPDWGQSRNMVKSTTEGHCLSKH